MLIPIRLDAYYNFNLLAIYFISAINESTYLYQIMRFNWNTFLTVVKHYFLHINFM